VILKVQQLFEEREELIEGFSRFLPPDWSFDNPEQEELTCPATAMIR
jgi:hypothetical protein